MNLTKKMERLFGPMMVYKTDSSAALQNFLNLEDEPKKALITKFTDSSTGHIDAYGLNRYLNEMRLDPEMWNMTLLDLKTGEQESVKMLTKVQIVFDAFTEQLGFRLPEFGFPRKSLEESAVDYALISKHKDSLKSGKCVWGEVTLMYDCGVVQLTDFAPLQKFDTSLDYFKRNSQFFSTEEWVDALLAGFNFNPDAFESIDKKLYLLQRFAPLVEKRLNMIELTKKGNSKSYCYSISPYEKLVASAFTRSTAFYNSASREPGFFLTSDTVVLDEIQSLRFPSSDLFSTLKTFLEQGEVKVGKFCAAGDAGLVLVGNASDNAFDVFAKLDPRLREPALIDRFTCLVEGSQIDRMTEDRKFRGKAFSDSYLTTMFHEMRNEFYYRNIVDEMIEAKGDTRSIEAVKKNACAFLKMLFPYACSVEDIDPSEFYRFCLKPAIDGRERVLTALRRIDEQYSKVQMPTFTVKGMN